MKSTLTILIFSLSLSNATNFENDIANFCTTNGLDFVAFYDSMENSFFKHGLKLSHALAKKQIRSKSRFHMLNFMSDTLIVLANKNRINTTGLELIVNHKVKRSILAIFDEMTPTEENELGRVHYHELQNIIFKKIHA